MISARSVANATGFPRLFSVIVVALIAVFLRPAAVAATANGTLYLSFWSGELRIFAHEDNTRVLLIDIDTGLPLSVSDSRINSINVVTNPFTLASAGDSFEGIGGLGGINDEIRVRIIAEDPSGGNEDKPVTVWTGSIDETARHPAGPPSATNPWISYLPAFSTVGESNGTEVGREFLGFTTREMYIFARKAADPTTILVEDLATNTDSDSDDTVTLLPADAVYADLEIEVYFLDDFEDDTVRLTSNVDVSVLVGISSANDDDWTVTPPSYASGDDGIELGTLFYTFAHRSLSVFPTQDGTTVTVTDLSDYDDSTVVFLSRGDTLGDYSLYTSIITSTSHGSIIPRISSPAVNILDGGDGFDDDFVKIESDKPILIYVGPVGSNTIEYADVAFSVPTGPDSRIIYAYAQNSGESNDLQIFGFHQDTMVTITSLSFTQGFRGTGHHDFVIGPGIGPSGWKQGTPTGDVWWGSSVWNGEMLRIESTKPITVINGDYDYPCFGAFVPFVLSTPTLPPVAVASASPRIICAGESVLFDGTGSYDQDTIDGGGLPTHAWDFDVALDSDGDGNPANDVQATGPTPVHTYLAVGAFTAQLTFTDDDGQSDSDFVEVLVESCQVEPCGECESGVTQLSLLYRGETATIEVFQGHIPDKPNKLLYGPTLHNPGDTFTVYGGLSGKIGSEASFYEDGVLNTIIHTSCSEPIGIGLVSGDFEVIDGYSFAGGRLLAMYPCTSPEDCDDANPCTNDGCDACGLCINQNNTDPCDDGDVCTGDDACSAGSCVGSPLDCNDANPCTDDLCDPVSGCMNTPNQPFDQDGDGYEDVNCLGDDCDDSSDATYPGAAEIQCNGIDEDCNGSDSCPSSCTGAAEASHRVANKEYAASDLANDLVCFLLPIGAVIAFRLWRRNK